MGQDTDRKKQLKEEYLRNKPDMGIFAVECETENLCYLCAAKDIKGKINSTLFQLRMPSHMNRELQSHWSRLGENAFTVRAVDTLEYDKDESKTDYTDDLKTLLSIWMEKMPHSKKL